MHSGNKSMAFNKKQYTEKMAFPIMRNEVI